MNTEDFLEEIVSSENNLDSGEEILDNDVADIKSDPEFDIEDITTFEDDSFEVSENVDSITLVTLHNDIVENTQSNLFLSCELSLFFGFLVGYLFWSFFKRNL